MKTILGLVADARNAPRRLWELYGLTLLSVAVTIYAGVNHIGWFFALVALTAAWGLFTALMAAFTFGKAVAYHDVADMLEDARRAMEDRRADLVVIANRLGDIEKAFGRVEGPS